MTEFKSKVSDVFDSVKFATNDNEPAVIRLHKVHATAALYESMFFNSDGLILSAPQFFDGIAGSDSMWRSRIFKLIKQGYIKIGLYNAKGSKNPITSLRDYISRIVAQETKEEGQRKIFHYSSRPNIANRISSDAYIRELDQRVWAYILHGSVKPDLGNDTVGMEYRSIIDFFEEFFAIEQENSSIYSIQESNYISYKDFFENSFKYSGVDPFALFNLQGVTEREKIISTLMDVRSAVNKFITENPFDLSEQTIIAINTVSNVLYNKYSLMNFRNIELHVPVIRDTIRRDMLEKVAVTANDTQELDYRYENTEVIRKESSLKSLSFDDIIGMREEIIKLIETDHLPSWQAALKAYRTNLRRTQNIIFDDNNNRDIVISEESDTYMFSSKNLRAAMEAAEKEAFINHIENLISEDSYTS